MSNAMTETGKCMHAYEVPRPSNLLFCVHDAGHPGTHKTLDGREWSSAPIALPSPGPAPMETKEQQQQIADLRAEAAASWKAADAEPHQRKKLAHQDNARRCEAFASILENAGKHRVSPADQAATNWTLYQAWRKRAEEAEAELVALKAGPAQGSESRTDDGNGPVGSMERDLRVIASRLWADLSSGQIGHTTSWCVNRLTEIAAALTAAPLAGPDDGKTEAEAVEGVVVQGATQWRPNDFSEPMIVSEHVVKTDLPIGTRVLVTALPARRVSRIEETK